ncbi:putative phospholipid ABC transporter permease protein MlaE [Fundidesulfovibrio magnetotacticus]|uniref:Putative phospholipid ABC transporter permease protein MlaE n=1 Tax=Fundidesulfovibrio magnetotacticus TaxID=2730080 RepID=A0A6V8LYP7_9BACT|nr:ABC transporter permease [Fundidesulfovibrio magnetotacticus]GFK95358.1 putative phospholipid ABC transporter permease protein MlaE [Fundidesulfovibrio magnetotacticus]
MGQERDQFFWLVNRLLECLRSPFSTKKYMRWQNWRHFAWVGADSLPIVTLIAACTGIILALQAAAQLEKVGALSYVANLVGVTIVAELGPLLTALILSGRAGAAFTAEIATMKISEEIDALEVMGLDSVRYLVWPKCLAMALMAPLLTVWADFAGVLSGGVFSVTVLGLSAKGYYDQTSNFLSLRLLFSGLVKSVAFGLTITLISCWQGFLAREGALDVGNRTTRSVVQSILMIVLLDLFFTALTYISR